MPSVESFTITYDNLNDYGTFSEGDAVTGKVTLILSKEITVKSLFVTAKGEGRVRWAVFPGYHRQTTYSVHKRYFKRKQFLIKEDSKGSVIPAGRHDFDFMINIPARRMPSSFSGAHGEIVYKLEARLSRRWWMDSTDEKKIHFVSTAFPNFQYLRSQPAVSRMSRSGLFFEGCVYMVVVLDRRVYAPGETMAISARINNTSSSAMIPRFTLVQHVVYNAEGHENLQRNVIVEEAHSRITALTLKEVKCSVTLPSEIVPTIEDGGIIKVDYHVQVMLTPCFSNPSSKTAKQHRDIGECFDPWVRIHVDIIPPVLALGPQLGVSASTAGAVGGSNSSIFPPPAGDVREHMNGIFPPPAGDVREHMNGIFPPPAGDVGEYMSDIFPCPAGAVGGSSSSIFPPPAAAAEVLSSSFLSPSLGLIRDFPARDYEDQSISSFSPSMRSLALDEDLSEASPSAFDSAPRGPTFQSPQSVSEFQPFVFFQPPSEPPATLTRSELPSTSVDDTDFLSQSNEIPPSYSFLYPHSTTENSDTEE